MTTHTQMIDMVDLYALDALEGVEMAEFESHLVGCAMCRRQLAESQAVTATLIADSDPPNHVWDRISVEIDSSEPRRLLRRRRMVLHLFSIAAVMAIALAGVLLTSNAVSPDQALVEAAERASSAPGSTVATFVVDDVAVAEVVLTTAGVGYVLPTEALVDLDESRTYQLWVINAEGDVISGGVLGHSPAPSSFTWTDGVSGFALTREVAGGVPVSDGDVVAVITDL